MAAGEGRLLVASFLLLNGNPDELLVRSDSLGRSPHDLLKRRVLDLDASKTDVDEAQMLDVLLSPRSPRT